MGDLLQLLRSSWRLAAAAAVASIVSGSCAAGLLASINAALSGSSLPMAAGIFCLLGFGKVAGQVMAQFLLSRLAQRSVIRLRDTLSREIVAAPLRRVEQLGPGRLLTALTDDVTTVSETLHALPNLAVNFALLAVCTAYLGWLSFGVLLGALAVVGLGAAGYALLRRRAYRCLRAGRGAYERLFGLFRDLIDGGMELRLYRGQRDAFLDDDLRPALANCQQQGTRSNDYFTLLEGWTQSLFYLLVGALLFVLPVWHPVPAHVLTGYLLTILFLMRPLVLVVGLLPVLSRGRVALENLRELRAALADRATPKPVFAPLPPSGEVELRGIRYRYPGEENGFQLGPIDFRLTPGEVVFVVGGNGCGKSTLAKVLTGLYDPEEGEVRLGGRPIAANERDDYRQRFSAILSDGHVFDRLPGPPHAGHERAARLLLDQLRIGHRVRVADGRLWVTGVSRGEQKRLALLSAYLEDRPFFVFDEWAANQDPFFKHVFYTQLLPELRARGKGVLVITHDDRYFAEASRVVRMDHGTIREG